jgi:transcriptional regulator with XRE-family HTH domain
VGPSLREGREAEEGCETITGALVHAARKALGWTQGDLASKAGVSVAEVARFEKSAYRTSRVAIRLQEAAAGAQFDGKHGVRLEEPTK